jgi:hypothetical protein
MDYDVAKLDRLNELLDRAQGGDTVVTSVRQPAALREALKLAVEMGMGETVNEVTNQALLDRLETFSMGVGLEVHNREHPERRPSLAGIALAHAELDHSPLAHRPELIEAAAREVEEHDPDADGEIVVFWAQCLADHGWSETAYKKSA